MTNKELEQKLCAAFEEATPDVLGSVLADCKKQEKQVVTFKSVTASWNRKFVSSAAAAILVICLGLGWGSGLFVDPTVPTDPYGPGTQPSTDYQPSFPLSLDWQMFASLVTVDGAVVETYPMKIKGEIEEGKPYHYRTLDIEVEGDFRYIFSSPKSDIFTNRFTQWPGDFTTEDFCYDKITNSPAWLGWAVNTEKEYYIGYWGEDFGYYLVASVDPNVKPAEILEHFELFVDSIVEPKEPEPTDPKPTEPEPTDPKPSVPDGFPADLNMDTDIVQEFQKLFDNDSWYTQALNEEFDDPRNIRLNDFLFCDMKPWSYTKHTREETEKLRQQFGITVEWWVDCYSMEAATVEEVLQTVFGYSMADFKESTDPYIRYLESTDCYYYGRTDSSLVQNVSVVGIRELEGGNIEVYYSCDWLYPENGFVTLKPVGDSYIVLSNKGL